MLEIEQLLSQDYKTIKDSILNKQFTVKDIGTTYRWIRFWEEKNILLEKSNNNKWRRYSFVEFIWIKIVEKLRLFNVSLKQIMEIKEQLLIDLHLYQFIESKKVKDTIKNISQKENINFYNKLEDIDKKELSKIKVNLILLLILDAIILKNHISLLINNKNEIFIYKERLREELLQDEHYRSVLLSSHINISISELLIEFINMNELNLLQDKLNLITPKERQIIELIREDNVKSLKIIFNSKKMDVVELVKEKQINLADKFSSVLMNKGYETLIVKTQKGQIVYCENTRKIKL